MDWSQAANILGALAAGVALLGAAIFAVRFVISSRRTRKLQRDSPGLPDYAKFNNTEPKRNEGA